MEGCKGTIGTFSVVSPVGGSEVVGGSKEDFVVVNEMGITAVACFGASILPRLPDSQFRGHQPITMVAVEEQGSKVASAITDRVAMVIVRASFNGVQGDSGGGLGTK